MHVQHGQTRDGFDGTKAGFVDLNRDGALQQRHGNDQPCRLALGEDQPLEARKRAAIDADPLADLEIGVWLGFRFREHDREEGSHLTLIDRQWDPAVSHNRDHVGRDENRQSLRDVKLAEQVALEQGKFQYLDPVRSAVPAAIEREETLVTFRQQVRRHGLFVPRLHVHRVPGENWIRLVHQELFLRTASTGMNDRTHPACYRRMSPMLARWTNPPMEGREHCQTLQGGARHL